MKITSAHYALVSALNKRSSYFLAVLIAILFKIWLGSCHDLFIHYSLHDHGRFNRLAHSILNELRMMVLPLLRMGLINIKNHRLKPLIIATPRIRKHADAVRPNLALLFPYLDGEKKCYWQNSFFI